VVDWYGEVRSDSDQLDGWQTRQDSFLYHHMLRQTWTVSDAGRLLIQRLIVAAATARHSLMRTHLGCSRRGLERSYPQGARRRPST
jgi:hypothetical protein